MYTDTCVEQQFLLQSLTTVFLDPNLYIEQQLVLYIVFEALFICLGFPVNINIFANKLSI